MSLDLLKKSLLEAPIVKSGEYDYIIHPITDGLPEIKPNLINEIILEIKKIIKSYGKIDKIVTIEAMGIPIATALSMEMNIPFTIIRKRQYSLPGEVIIEQKTGYSKSKLYLNGLNKGDRIVIVDDVLSTGGTLRGVLTSLNKLGVIVKSVIIVINKGKSVKKIIDEYNVNIHTIANIKVINGKVFISNL